MKALLFANTDWYLYNFRLPLARALRDNGWEVVLLSPPGKYSQILLDARFRWIPFPLSRKSMNPLKEAATILRLWKLYRREQPDIFHHFTIKCILYGSIACGLMGKSHRAVNAITGLGYTFTGNNLLRRAMQSLALMLYRLALKKSWIIFQNPEDRVFFLQQGIAQPNRTSLIPGSGVDLNYFTPQAEAEGVPVIAFVGRLLWDKGVEEFVEAARMLKKKNIQARFVLVGSSDSDNPGAVPQSTIENWVSQKVVEWLGWQEDMRRIYAQTHLICLPSYREGMPKSLAEAAACARALVASDVPGCREIVENGVNGLLVPPRDVPALAEALEKLISDDDLRRQMAVRSRHKAEDGFSAEAISSATLEVYHMVLKS